MEPVKIILALVIVFTMKTDSIPLKEESIYDNKDLNYDEDPQERDNMPSQSIDQIISSSQQTVHATDFMQDGRNVLVELDMLYRTKDWIAIQQAIDMEKEVQKVSITGLRKKRKATRLMDRRWTNNVVPYVIEEGTFNSHETKEIEAAIKDWEEFTCLDFQPRSDERNYIILQNGAGCSSYVGMIGGGQRVSLAPGCRSKGVIVHELGHAIGFQHEQTRPDRNEHVEINYNNIEAGKRFNFQQYPKSVVNDYGVPYDYSSVMHYGQYAFSKNGQRTIETIDKSKQYLIGKRTGHSFKDIKLTNLMYNCADSCDNATCPDEGFLGKDCKCYCPVLDSEKPLKECSEDDGDGTAFPEEVGCKDEKAHCGYWASKKLCFSAKYAAFMDKNCALTCDKCGGGRKCHDENIYCSYWASVGYCKRFAYTQQHCKRSCKTC